MRSSGARLLRLAARSLQGEAGVSTSAAGSLLRPVISPCCARGPAASAAPRSAVPPPFHPAGAAAWREHALPAAAHALGRAQWRAGFADQAGKGAAGGGDDGSSSEATGGSSAGADSDDGSDGPTVEQLTAELQERERVVEELQGKVRPPRDGSSAGPRRASRRLTQGGRAHDAPTPERCGCRDTCWLAHPPQACPLPTSTPSPLVPARRAQVTELADSFKRSLAEMENLRQRTTRQVENAHKFAVEVRRARLLAGAGSAGCRMVK